MEKLNNLLQVNIKYVGYDQKASHKLDEVFKIILNNKNDYEKGKHDELGGSKTN